MANDLKFIRTKFINETGRFDLVVDLVNYADNGADFFIQAGQRYLDTVQDHRKSVSRFQKDIVVGSHKFEMRYVRNIEKVEVTNADGRVSLIRQSYDWMRKNYPAATVAEQVKGIPTYYTPLVNYLSPEQKALMAVTGATPPLANEYVNTFTYDWEDLRFQGDDIEAVFQYDGLMFRPVSDGTYTITVHGRFYSVMVVDTDVSYHSINNPELLVLASKLCLYAFYDNTQGMVDVLRALDVWLKPMDEDLVRAEIVQAGVGRKGL